MRLVLLVFLSMLISPVAMAVSVPLQIPPPVIEEFTAVEPIKFHDATGTSTLPSIPKSWRLISVANGEKSNSSNLWFQDSDGSIYLLQGFTSKNKFFFHENIFKIPAK